MKIAIDIDDCISNTTEVDFATCWEYNKKLNPNDNKKYVNDYHNAPTIFGFTKQQNTDFYMYQREMCVSQDLIKPKVFSDKIINKLYKNGHDIIILSKREDKHWGDALVEAKKWLKKYGINYTQCVVNCGNKGVFCKKNDIDLLIDDNLKWIKQCNDKGIKTITFNNNYNLKYYPKNLRNYKNNLNQYASCWIEVLEIIKTLSKDKLEGK